MRAVAGLGADAILFSNIESHDDVINAISIATINAGTHPNPSFGGDTFYCWSEVLKKWSIPGRQDIDALRLRMVVIKNQTAESLESSHIASQAKQEYRPNVVLDLDYTVLMPRKAK